MRKLILISVVMLAVCLCFEAAAVPGVVQTGNFNAVIGPDGTVTGGGDGYEWPGGDVWMYYDQAPGGPWWNQWWYNDPFQWTGKEVRLTFDFNGTGSAEVTINWSTPLWIDQPGPPGPNSEDFIERLDGLANDINWPVVLPGMGAGRFDSGWFRLPIDYNPEWVSVDIRGESMQILDGVLEHVCLVPEPSSMALIGIGLLALMKRK